MTVSPAETAVSNMSLCRPERSGLATPSRRFGYALALLVAFFCPGFAHACGTVKHAIDLIQTQQVVFLPGAVPSEAQLDRFIRQSSVVELDEVDAQMGRWALGRLASSVRASLSELQDLALIGARFGPQAAVDFVEQSSLRDRAARTERVLSVACRENGGNLNGAADAAPGGPGGSASSSGQMRSPSPLTQLKDMQFPFNEAGNLTGFAYLVGVIALMCGLLAGVRATVRQAHAHIYDRRTCLLRAMVEVDEVAVDGRIKVLGKRGFRFVADPGDFAGSIFDIVRFGSKGYVTIGRSRLPINVQESDQSRCSALFERPLSLSKVREFLALSRVSTHPVVDIRHRRHLYRIFLRPLARIRRKIRSATPTASWRAPRGRPESPLRK